MSDLVTRIWSGPFQAHATDPSGQVKTVEIGEEIQITRAQADENPGWFAPLPGPTLTPNVKPLAALVPENAEVA
jgi:hypothetical protein